MLLHINSYDEELHDLGIQGCGAFFFKAELIAYFNEKKL